MIADHPLSGVGPNMIKAVYAQYRDADAVEQLNPHLHNVPLQIAAERGLPALIVWLVVHRPVVSDLFRRMQHRPASAPAGRRRRSRRWSRCSPPGSSSTTSATPSS